VAYICNPRTRRLRSEDHKLKASLSYTKKQKKKKKIKKTKKSGRALVAHTCNPSYSGDRDQEDHDLKPAQANSATKKQKQRYIYIYTIIYVHNSV
jgi:hypothetical protein